MKQANLNPKPIKPVRTLFIGSNWEALSTLKVLHEDERFEIIGLITQPDKPVGRKKVLQPTEIKQYALDHKIEVFHTLKESSNYQKALELFSPELNVCKSFGEIIPEFFLQAPKYSSINVHYSLLPKYRGAVPIQKAILDGEGITGITYVEMVKKLDAGGILKRVEEPILKNDTNQTLRERLVGITGETIGDTLDAWVNGEITPIAQEESKATFCWQKDISKDNAFIDWSQRNVVELDRMVRALKPWPIAWTFLDQKRLKIFDVELVDDGPKLKPGEYKFDGENLYVGTKDSSIRLLSVQIEGKQQVDAKSFAMGRAFK